MAYLQDLERQSVPPLMGQQMGLQPGQAVSSFFPQWETQTAQYQAPSVYSVEQLGYLQNEFAYSVMVTRATAKSQAPLRIYDNRGEHPDEVKDHKLRKLLEHPNHNIDEVMFWQIKQIIQDIAGFCAWEIERNNVGEPIRLWLMRPDWCSFIRAQHKPLAYVRYQPWGLEPYDVPIENILFFTSGEDFHPLYPGVKFYSPLMHALPQIKVDNAMTFFLNDFVEHGARPSGIVSVTNTINDTVAEDYRKRWEARYGGTHNWSSPVFLGLGSTYSPIQMNFKDMAFPELDARTEIRICRAFNIDPIVVDAKVGMDISSYNNKEQAEKGWFFKWVLPSWKSDAGIINAQLIDEFEDVMKTNPDAFYTQFDTSDVYSLVEDRNKKVERAVNLYTKKIARLNEAREEAGLSPVEGDEGEAFFQGSKSSTEPMVDAEGNPIKEGEDVPGADHGEPVEQPDSSQLEGMDDKPGEAGGIDAKLRKKTPAQEAAEEDEVKKFKRFAAKRIKEGKLADILEYEFRFVQHEDADLLVRNALAGPIKHGLDQLLGQETR